MNLPKYVQNLINILSASGESAYAVGGCVRDMIMGREPNDFDMTTSAPPERTQEIFESAGFRTIPTGMKHGTVTVIADSHPVEITTYRIDGEYNDSRHPDSVTFTKRVEDDLARRDFTVNAMAYNEKDGIVDVFGGREDIERRLIRCVGAPRERFREDALRILRAVRFSAVLGFDIDPDTLEAMRSERDGLKAVSRERIRVEFEKTLVCERARFGLDVLFDTGIFDVIFPSLSVCDTERTSRKIGLLPLDFELRMACLLADSDAQQRRLSVSSLKLSTVSEKKIFLLLEGLSAQLPNPSDAYEVRKYIKIFGSQAENAARLRSVMLGQDSNDVVEAISCERAKNPCLELSSLNISGADLISLGITDGKIIGETLSYLLDGVIAHPEFNQKDTLATLAINFHEKRELK